MEKRAKDKACWQSIQAGYNARCIEQDCTAYAETNNNGHITQRCIALPKRNDRIGEYRETRLRNIEEWQKGLETIGMHNAS